MKKIRILSLMLALATVAASLPISVSAKSTGYTPVNEELLAEADVLNEANWTNGDDDTLNADVVSVSENGTNTALYMYDASENRTNKFVYTINESLSAGTYRIKYDWTAQTPIDTGLFNDKPRNTDVMNFFIAGSTREGKLTSTNQSRIIRDFTLSSDVTSLPITISYIDQNGRAGMILPKTFDNFEIYKLENGVESAEPVITRTFENGLENGDTWKKTVNGATTNASLTTESDYIRVDAVTRTGTVEEAAEANAYNTAATYSPDEQITLTAGVYEFTFDGRMSYFFSDTHHNNDEYVYEYEKLLEADENAVPARGFNIKMGTSVWECTSSQWRYWTGENVHGWWGSVDTVYHRLYRDKYAFGMSDYRDVVVTITGENADSGEVEVLGTSTETVQHYWQDGYKVTFTVPLGETYTLNGISFGGTGFAYDNDAFDVNNLSLKLVEAFHEELIAQSDVLDEANWTNGDDDTLNADVVSVSENGTNTALYMYDSKEYPTNKYTYTLKANLDAGTYRIKIDRTAQIDGVEQVADNYYIRVNGSQQELKDLTYDGAETYTKDITLSAAVTQIPFEFYYIADNARLGMIYPRTFDSIEIYEIVDGVEADTPVVVRTFENGLENGDTWKKSINKATAVDAELITESDYVRIDAVTGNGTVEEAVAAGAYSAAAKYSPDEAITLEPGVYEFSFDGRMSYFFSNSYHNNDEYVYEYEKLLENDADAVPEKGFNAKTSGWESTSTQWKYWKDANNKGFWNKVDTVYHKLYRDNNPACGDYNYRDVAVTVTGENDYTGDVEVLGTMTATVKHNWQNGYKLTFTVPYGETYTLDGISFGGTGLAYDNDAFDVSNFSLKCVEPIVEPDEQPENYGDADNNGAVTPLDVVYVARYVAEWSDYNDETVNTPALDLDGDGTVTIQDVTILARHIAKWIGYETLPYVE